MLAVPQLLILPKAGLIWDARRALRLWRVTSTHATAKGVGHTEYVSLEDSAASAVTSAHGNVTA